MAGHFISFHIQVSFVQPLKRVSKMNTRQRINQPSTGPTRGTGRPVFVDFTPTHEWRGDEDGSAVLVLALPGFTREQIKVTAEPSGKIRVRGLRNVGNRNWSRFNSEFRVPEDCSMTGIRAKYDNGNLFITIPKKNPSKTPKEEPRVTSAESEQPHPLSSSKPSESQLPQPFSPPKQSALPPQRPQPPLPPPLPLPLPHTEQIQPQLPQVPSQLKEQERPPQREIQPEAPMPANIPRVESDKKPFRSHADAPSEVLYSAKHEEGLKEWENPESLVERILKGGTEKGKEPSALVRTADKMEQERKEHLDNRARETEALIGARLSSELKLEDYVKLAREKLSKERQSLVNIGAAVLVIASLGVYIYNHHQISASRNKENFHAPVSNQCKLSHVTASA